MHCGVIYGVVGLESVLGREFTTWFGRGLRLLVYDVGLGCALEWV